MSDLSSRTKALATARDHAAAFEALLDEEQCKRLGQFFSGLRLSRLLAALSFKEDYRSVLDPMAGHGDLLDGVVELAVLRGQKLSQVDAVEVDEATAGACRTRLLPWAKPSVLGSLSVLAGNAFDQKVVGTLKPAGYDLVITNPPYVRYQRVSQNGANGSSLGGEQVRGALLEIVQERVPSKERGIWTELVRGYSGLADLSVPCWLLAGLLVRPGGHLALVAPATWCTRNYADVLQYLLSRCFKIEIIVADRQPGWFSRALVRTQLIVAQRLESSTTAIPIRMRPSDARATALWAEISKSAEQGGSLVGAAFPGEHPEQDFAAWVATGRGSKEPRGIVVKEDGDECARAVLRKGRARGWLKRLEPDIGGLPLFSRGLPEQSGIVPRLLRDVVPAVVDGNLWLLEEAGINVGQGLRTGCNGFFYVDFVEDRRRAGVCVRANAVLGSPELVVPSDMLRLVVRSQSELGELAAGRMPTGRVLDLREYVLPEDRGDLDEAGDRCKGKKPYGRKVMPPAVAELVRRAAKTRYPDAEGTLIPDLSAVRTNARAARGAGGSARFWYMLPDFARRHLPDAFVARINHETPRVVRNCGCGWLIDANFSTLWGAADGWSPEGVTALLNSCWSRACMEAVGTPMGGGALKLEATQLRMVPMPRLAKDEMQRLHALGMELSIDSVGPADIMNLIDHLVIGAALGLKHREKDVKRVAGDLREAAAALQQARQRRVHDHAD